MRATRAARAVFGCAALLAGCKDVGPPLNPWQPQAEIRLDAPPASAILYGRVVGFAGNVSIPSVIKFSLNAGPERSVQQYPPYPTDTTINRFRGEAHPLANGPNIIRIRAYLRRGSGPDQLIGSHEFSVTVDVPTRRYSARVIDVPGSVDVKGWLLGNDGRVAGHWWSSADVYHAFTWRDGVLVQLDSMTSVQDLNNVGQVLGRREPPVLNSTTVIWRDGMYTTIDSFPGAVGINDLGDLVRPQTIGYWQDRIVRYAYPTPWRPITVIQINKGRNIIGAVYNYSKYPAPVLWASATSYQALEFRGSPTAPGYAWVDPLRLSDSGHVIMRAVLDPYYPSSMWGSRVIVYHNGASTDLSCSAGFSVVATDVNTSGTVAGIYKWDGSPRPFIWRNGRTTDVEIDSPDWEILEVWGINDTGQMTAHARHRTTGRYVTLLLTPI